MASENAKKKLKPAEKLFCQLYAGSSDYFNNATRAYGIAYEKVLPPIGKPKTDWTKTEALVYNLASVEGHNLLIKPSIRQECEKVLKSDFKNEMADKELNWTIKQREDLSAKMTAIKEYNKLKQRIIEKTDITSDGEPLKITFADVFNKK